MFQVIVEPSDTPGKTDVSVTHNGHQWTTIWLYDRELRVVAETISDYAHRQEIDNALRAKNDG